MKVSSKIGFKSSSARVLKIKSFILVVFLTFKTFMYICDLLVFFFSIFHFTECIETFYGINCTKRCSTDCVNNTCKHDTGVCFVYKQVLQSQSNKLSISTNCKKELYYMISNSQYHIYIEKVLKILFNRQYLYILITYYQYKMVNLSASSMNGASWL